MGSCDLPCKQPGSLAGLLHMLLQRLLGSRIDARAPILL